jgi:hypothetical protein
VPGMLLRFDKDANYYCRLGYISGRMLESVSFRVVPGLVSHAPTLPAAR